MIAVLGACVAILIYLTVAFRKAPHPIRYGVCALVAMLHDVLVVLGIASILGELLGLEVDALFLTALLTVISFSVHDTIVVFDRIREHLKTTKDIAFPQLVGESLSETFVRSINTSLMVLVMVISLAVVGPESTRLFAIVLAIGMFFGTYSSIFLASPLLVLFESWQKPNKK